ncbi:MAG: sugar ABC transporter permease [Clostridiales bacterium]|nr:sugar ABC transporter permease [Clostridiales bacterium]
MKRRQIYTQNRSLTSYLMLAPWLTLFTVFTILPILSSVVLSFTNFDMVRAPKFLGINNYLRLLLEDDVFLISVKNTLIFAIVTGPVGYLFSFLIAWMINDAGKFARPALTLLFYSPALAGNVYFVWQFIFSGDSVGLINGFLLNLGMINDPIQWLTDPSYNLYVCIIVMLWSSMGTGFLAFVAGFKGLNRSLFEAAAVDGLRNRWQELWYVTLPQMVPQLLIGAVLSISGAFAVGYQTMALCGFPSTDYSVHTIVLHILDYGNYRFEMGYASAIAVVLFAAMVLSWFAINRALRGMRED